MKQTAVEWLIEQYDKKLHIDLNDESQAKQMEKEQMIDALKYADLDDKSAEWYYKEIYGK
jgi:hypothetical protein